MASTPMSRVPKRATMVRMINKYVRPERALGERADPGADRAHHVFAWPQGPEQEGQERVEYCPKDAFRRCRGGLGGRSQVLGPEAQPRQFFEQPQARTSAWGVGPPAGGWVDQSAVDAAHERAGWLPTVDQRFLCRWRCSPRESSRLGRDGWRCADDDEWPHGAFWPLGCERRGGLRGPRLQDMETGHEARQGAGGGRASPPVQGPPDQQGRAGSGAEQGKDAALAPATPPRALSQLWRRT